MLASLSFSAVNGVARIDGWSAGQPHYDVSVVCPQRGPPFDPMGGEGRIFHAFIYSNSNVAFRPTRGDRQLVSLSLSGRWAHGIVAAAAAAARWTTGHSDAPPPPHRALDARHCGLSRALERRRNASRHCLSLLVETRTHARLRPNGVPCFVVPPFGEARITWELFGTTTCKRVKIRQGS